MTTNSWKRWYTVKSVADLGESLKEAKILASKDYPKSAIADMMTPIIKRQRKVTKVLVIGK